MNCIMFFYGVFFALPLSILNVLPYGMKIDDVILFIALIVFPILSFKKGYHVTIPLSCLLFIIITVLFASLSFLKGINSTNVFLGDSAGTVIGRIIQSLLILILITFLKNTPHYLLSFFKGYVIAATLSLIIFFGYYVTHINISSFTMRGVYFAKDIFQYNDDLPFTVHVNTLGSFFLIAFFLLKYNFPKYQLLSYLFLLPSLLLISKGDMLAILTYFAYVFYKRNNLNAFLSLIGLLILVLLMPYLYNVYLSLSDYRVYASGRDELYGASLSSIIDNPFGYGLGMQNNILYSITGIDFPAHNILLSIGIELGLLYLFLLVAYIIGWLLLGKVDYKIIFISFLVIGMFGNAMYFYKFHSLAIAPCFLSVWHINFNHKTKQVDLINNENTLHS
ncbi:TPA: O74 family O-antigen polymerase [Escherichia coli]